MNAIYDCDDADVDGIDWLASHHKRKLLDKNLDHAHEVLDWCDYYDVKIVTPSDEEYPYPLRSLDKLPPVLYYRGNLPDFKNELCISVVGTRNLTMEGQRNAYNLGYGLAKGGAIVISGMAKGIDSVAQKGALYAGGRSVAVLGCGIDVVYPKENLALMEKLAAVGAVITAVLSTNLDVSIYFLLIAPLLAIFYSTQILYSYSMTDKISKYIIDKLDKPLEKILGTEEWESYSWRTKQKTKTRSTGIRKDFFRGAMWVITFLCLGAVIGYVSITGSWKVWNIILVALASILELRLCFKIENSLYKKKNQK